METDDGVSIKGLPEYCFSGVWRRISLCMERLADTEQKLVCKQLGYDESASISTSRVMYTSEAPHVTIGNCSMDAKSLQECEVRETTTDCKMREQLICNRVICPKERVRLVGGSIEHQGQVEVCSDGRWGTLQTSQPQQVAREVCRRLDFNEITSDASSKPVYNCSIICGSLTCEESTNNFDLLRISCQNIDLESCDDDGQVRLTDGYNYREGRVEVCFNGVWGSVCNLRQKGIAGAACYQAGFLREGAMATSYGEESRGYCCSNITITLQSCQLCFIQGCDILGVVCQAWAQLQPTNNASECTVQPPMIEPTGSSNIIASTTASSVTDYTSLDSPTTTQSRVTEPVTTIQPTSTPPDNHTALLGAIIGVLFALLLATLVGWMCTCIIMHRNKTNTTKSTSSTTNNPLITDDNYSLGQVIECVYNEATPTQPPPTDPTNNVKSKTSQIETATYDYAGPDLSLSQPTNPTNYDTVTTSDEGIGDYDVITDIKQKPKPSNPPSVKVETSKSEDEFYNAEEHMYAAIDKKAKRENKPETGGEEENKMKKGANHPMYDVAMPGEAVWGVEGAAVCEVEGEYSRLKR